MVRQFSNYGKKTKRKQRTVHDALNNHVTGRPSL